jgi:uncharacterized repeat protein (TIGR01451 family)
MVNFTLVVSNNGPETAEKVVVKDHLPKELVCARYSLNHGQSWQDWEGEVKFAQLAPNSHLIILIRAQLSRTACNSFTNTASVSSLTTDPRSGNNQCSTTLKVQCNCSRCSKCKKRGCSK